jgi:hypothetical protein
LRYLLFIKTISTTLIIHVNSMLGKGKGKARGHSALMYLQIELGFRDNLTNWKMFQYFIPKIVWDEKARLEQDLLWKVNKLEKSKSDAEWMIQIFHLAPRGILTPGSAHARPSARNPSIQADICHRYCLAISGDSKNFLFS